MKPLNEMTAETVINLSENCESMTSEDEQIDEAMTAWEEKYGLNMHPRPYNELIDIIRNQRQAAVEEFKRGLWKPIEEDLRRGRVYTVYGQTEFDLFNKKNTPRVMTAFYSQYDGFCTGAEGMIRCFPTHYIDPKDLGTPGEVE